MREQPLRSVEKAGNEILGGADTSVSSVDRTGFRSLRLLRLTTFCNQNLVNHRVSAMVIDLLTLPLTGSRGTASQLQ